MPQPTSVPTPAPGTTLDAAMVAEPVTGLISDGQGFRGDLPAWMITLIVVGLVVAILGAVTYVYRRLR